MKVYRIEVKRQAIEVDLDRDDLITIKEAADIRGVTLTSIISMLDTGTLPTYTLTDEELPGVRNQRLTSRKAVMELLKAEKKDGKAHKPSLRHNEAYVLRPAAPKSAKAARELEAVPA